MAFRKGINHHSVKLTEEDVKLIRSTQLLISNRSWAKVFNISDSAISLIRSGKTWKHI